MANANAPRGLIPVQQNGLPTIGSYNIYYVPASYGSAIYIGDPVIPSGDSDSQGIPGVTLASAGGGAYLVGSMCGIVAGGQPQVAVTRDQPIYHPASTAQYILVCDDPNQLFAIQEDSVGGALTTANSWANADLVSGSGSTVTGYSGWQLDSSTANTTNTLQLRILRLLQEADNAIGTNAKWIVRINLHSLWNTTGL